MAARWLCAGARAKTERDRTGGSGLATATGGHLRTVISRHQELFRDQGIQFLRSLRAIRRSSRRPYGEPASLRKIVVCLNAAPHQRRRSDATQPHADRSLCRQDRRQGRHADARRARRLSKEGRLEGRLLAEPSGAALARTGAVMFGADPDGEEAKNKTRPRYRPGLRT